MKLPALLLAIALTAAAANLGDVKTVYLLPMTNGLDQFLAIRLTTGLVLQVVTDPQKADVIMTDKIGPGFEAKLVEMFGAKPKMDDDAKDDKGDNKTPPMQGGSHARGAVFLVNPKTHDVIWSVYERPKNGTPDELNHVADKIAGKLNKDLRGTK